MARPKVFEHFREVQEELSKTGAAIFRDKDSVESLIIEDPSSIKYIHSYAEDSPFFLALAEGRILGSRCSNPRCKFVFATPRSHCMVCGRATEWTELPKVGRVHSWTTCHYGGEAFLKDTPYNLAMIEFEGADSLLLARLKDAVESELYVGMPVEARFAEAARYRITDVWFVPAKT